ncbi:DUF4870 domain-containing protein [Bacillus hwajinpoensis]|uniref:DUF4870 domain-containing protein n=1 Tax=Guptibacillus hwajinpoensis TaxID=208199 RepID=A0A845ENH8_9BACL|nr:MULTISPECIES: DUF4870 domain-containing protein [Bacillaceae]MCA0991635.1 DUF4870 domain-containing protein [Pseudalkalibacillus hwajinpoensis]MYL61941.1 DUF4870 domain-containing protein [Pseudalkalibacillus hwajinpoensis]PFG14804.1 uncharacterized protein DUF4870 [Bacillus sp. es.036]
MSVEKVMSSLCYFSVFFAPFLFPIIVYFVVRDEEVSYHAKRSIVSHLLPFLTIILALLAVFVMDVGVVIILGFILFSLLNVVVFIWNIVKGIQVLRW